MSGPFVFYPPGGAGGGGTFSAGVSTLGNSLGNTGTVSNQLVLAGGNNITLSQATDAAGATVTISAPNTVAQTNVAFSAGAASSTFQTLSFQDSNNFSFSNNAGQIRANHNLAGTSTGSAGANVGISMTHNSSGLNLSITAAAQSAQTGNIYGSSQTTGQSSSSSYDHRTLTIVGMGANSVGWSAGSLLISAPNTIAQTNQSIGIYGSSQTTGQSSSSTVDARSLTVVGQGIISVGMSAGSLLISATAAGGGGGFTGGVSTGGGTAGNTGTQTGQVIFAGGNNITLSVSTAAGGAQTITVSGVNTVAQTSNAFSAGAASSTFQTLSFQDTNNVSFSNNAGQIRITHALAGTSTGFAGAGVSGSMTHNSSGLNLSLSISQSNQTGNIYGSSQTTGQSSSSSYDHRSLSIVGMGAVSVGWSNSSLLISAPNTIAQTSNAFSAGAASSTFQTLSFQDSNNFSFSNNAGQIRANHNLAGTSTGFAGANISGSITHNSSGINLSLSVAAPGAAAENNWFNLLGANTAGDTTASGSTIGLSGLGVTLSGTNGSVIVVSGGAGGAAPMLSYYEPDYIKGATLTQSNSNGTVYFQPFRVDENISMYRMNLIQQLTTQATTTMSLSASVSGAAAYSATGQWGQSGTVMLFSRVSTGTNTNSSRLISFYSNSYSYSVGVFASVSASTNVSSATASHTTQQNVGFLASVGSDGGTTTGSISSTGSSTFSSTSTNANSFSSSRAFSFASANFSQVRPIFVPFATSLTPGDYWLAHIQSSSSGSTNLSLQRVASLAPGILYYSTNTSGYAEIGSTATIANSNFRDGWGSYSASSQTSTTIPMTAISGMSQYQMYFQMMAAIK